jgi:hypothetical protein
LLQIADLVNVAPLQLSEEVFRVHSARFNEALVTATLYLDARDLKSTCNVKPQLALRMISFCHYSAHLL